MLKLKPLITDKKFKARSLGWEFAKEMSEDLSQSSRTLLLTEDLKGVKGNGRREIIEEPSSEMPLYSWVPAKVW